MFVAWLLRLKLGFAQNHGRRCSAVLLSENVLAQKGLKPVKR